MASGSSSDEDDVCFAERFAFIVQGLPDDTTSASQPPADPTASLQHTTPHDVQSSVACGVDHQSVPALTDSAHPEEPSAPLSLAPSSAAAPSSRPPAASSSDEDDDVPFALRVGQVNNDAGSSDATSNAVGGGCPTVGTAAGRLTASRPPEPSSSDEDDDVPFALRIMHSAPTELSGRANARKSATRSAKTLAAEALEAAGSGEDSAADGFDAAADAWCGVAPTPPPAVASSATEGDMIVPLTAVPLPQHADAALIGLNNEARSNGDPVSDTVPVTTAKETKERKPREPKAAKEPKVPKAQKEPKAPKAAKPKPAAKSAKGVKKSTVGAGLSARRGNLIGVGPSTAPGTAAAKIGGGANGKDGNSSEEHVGPLARLLAKMKIPPVDPSLLTCPKLEDLPPADDPDFLTALLSGSPIFRLVDRLSKPRDLEPEPPQAPPQRQAQTAGGDPSGDGGDDNDPEFGSTSKARLGSAYSCDGGYEGVAPEDCIAQSAIQNDDDDEDGAPTSSEPEEEQECTAGLAKPFMAAPRRKRSLVAVVSTRIQGVHPASEENTAPVRPAPVKRRGCLHRSPMQPPPVATATVVKKPLMTLSEADVIIGPSSCHESTTCDPHGETLLLPRRHHADHGIDSVDSASLFAPASSLITASSDDGKHHGFEASATRAAVGVEGSQQHPPHWFCEYYEEALTAIMTRAAELRRTSEVTTEVSVAVPTITVEEPVVEEPAPVKGKKGKKGKAAPKTNKGKGGKKEEPPLPSDTLAPTSEASPAVQSGSGQKAINAAPYEQEVLDLVTQMCHAAIDAAKVGTAHDEYFCQADCVAASHSLTAHHCQRTSDGLYHRTPGPGHSDPLPHDTAMLGSEVNAHGAGSDCLFQTAGQMLAVPHHSSSGQDDPTRSRLNEQPTRSLGDEQERTTEQLPPQAGASAVTGFKTAVSWERTEAFAANLRRIRDQQLRVLAITAAPAGTTIIDAAFDLDIPVSELYLVRTNSPAVGPHSNPVDDSAHSAAANPQPQGAKDSTTAASKKGKGKKAKAPPPKDAAKAEAAKASPPIDTSRPDGQDALFVLPLIPRIDWDLFRCGTAG